MQNEKTVLIPAHPRDAMHCVSKCFVQNRAFRPC
jgi:hypothetical protein